MKRLHREAVVPYNCRQIHALIVDVGAYQDFLPWCEKSTIDRTHTDGSVLATMTIRYKGFRIRLATHNSSVEHESVVMRLAAGPFKRLHGEWRLAALGKNGCKVTLDFEYEFANLLYDRLFAAAFARIVLSLIEAFLERARVMYA